MKKKKKQTNKKRKKYTWNGRHVVSAYGGIVIL